MDYCLKGYYLHKGYTKDDTNGYNLKTTGNDVTTPRKEKLYTIIIPSITTQWLNFLTYKLALDTVTDRKLKDEAGASDKEGLREKAGELYQKANALDVEVKKVDSQVNAAKVLKAKAGGKDDEGKLRKLAEKLYEAANALKTAVSAEADVSDDNAAENLGEAVGDSETTATDKLRQKLKDLYDQTQDDQLKQKAQGVRNQYLIVEQAFQSVQNQKATYSGGDKLQKYNAVEEAWNAFNAVYMPEEQLATAANELQLALHQFSTANILDMHTKAENVKKKFEGWGTGVISKFELVKKQLDAYDAGKIKDGKYTPLESAFDAFNKLYREAISIPKLYSIIVPSIISILSDRSPKTKFVGSLGGFGGWKQYNDGGTPVYAWIWHFFDILIVIKITVAVIFIYSLHYRESLSY